MATPFPTLDDVTEAHAAVETARGALIDALSSLPDGMAKALQAVAQAYSDWALQVEAYNEQVGDLIADYEMCMGERSERWQESDTGKERQAIAAALDACMITTDQVEPFTLTVTLGTVCDVETDDPEEVVPETPELPEVPA
jgi:hypothetical protein